LATDAAVGETVMAVSTAAVTVKAAVPKMSESEGSVAVMVAAPTAAPVARPWEPEALETVASEVDDQVTEVVMFAVLRSE